MFLLHSSIAKLIIVQPQHLPDIGYIKQHRSALHSNKTVHLLPNPDIPQGTVGPLTKTPSVLTSSRACLF